MADVGVAVRVSRLHGSYHFHSRRRATDRVLGTLGLFLIGLTAWAAPRLESPNRLGVLVGRSVLVAVGLVGRVVDRLPLPSTAPGSPGRGSQSGAARDLAVRL